MHHISDRILTLAVLNLIEVEICDLKVLLGLGRQRRLSFLSGIVAIAVTALFLEDALPSSNAPMSKQDAVASGLRIHLHQQGFAWGFGGVSFKEASASLFITSEPDVFHRYVL